MVVKFSVQRRSAVTLVQQRGIVRPKDFAALGVHNLVLRLLEPMSLVGRAPGVIVDATRMFFPLAVRAAVRWPNAVISGFSALNLHGFCAQPPEVWLAIDHRATPPKPVIPLHVAHVRALATDPDVSAVTFGPIELRAFTAERSLVELLQRMETVPLGPLAKVVRRAVHGGHVASETLLAIAQRRRCVAVVKRALELLLAGRDEDFPDGSFGPAAIDEEAWSLRARGYGAWFFRGG